MVELVYFINDKLLKVMILNKSLPRFLFDVDRIYVFQLSKLLLLNFISMIIVSYEVKLNYLSGLIQICPFFTVTCL